VGYEAPEFAMFSRVVAKITEMKLKDISCTAVFEYFSRSKTKDIPNGTMAFNRTGRATALIFLRWDNAIRDRSVEAREIAHEIAGTLLGDKSLLHDPLSFGYGNYGGRPD
jgi:hypothetical protein